MHQSSSADLDFQRAFEACEVAPEQFDHAAHVRLAYVYLTSSGIDDTVARTKRALLTFLAHLKAGDAKYHETLTRAWVMAVDHFMRHSVPCESAVEFIERNPRLLDTQIMLTHYSRERLFSAEARAGFVAPDIQAIPSA